MQGSIERHKVKITSLLSTKTKLQKSFQELNYSKQSKHEESSGQTKNRETEHHDNKHGDEAKKKLRSTKIQSRKHYEEHVKNYNP